jgi:hypothetical protein
MEEFTIRTRGRPSVRLPENLILDPKIFDTVVIMDSADKTIRTLTGVVGSAHFKNDMYNEDQSYQDPHLVLPNRR